MSQPAATLESPASAPWAPRWLIAWARRIAPGVEESALHSVVRLAMFLIAFAAQLATLLITWDVWTVRSNPVQPPNLPVLSLPAIGFAWIVLTTLLLALIFPPQGVLLHGAAMLAALVFDQHRLEPQFIGLWLLLWACVSPRGAWFGRWFLASMWLWAGLHKFISPEWWGVTTDFMCRRIGLDPQLHFWLALSVAAFETGVGLAAIFTRRLAALLCLLQHAGILLFLSPLAYDFNLGVWPWNAATGIVGAWLFRSAPAACWERWPRTAAQWSIVAALFLVPGTYYFGWINPHLAHILYSEHMPKAWATTGEDEFEQLHAWRNLAIPFPDSHRLFIHDFSLRASPGHKLYIQDPRHFVDDRFLLMQPDRRVVEIDRQRFVWADGATGELAGVMHDDRNAAFLLKKRGVKLELSQAGQGRARLVVAATFNGIDLGEHEAKLLAALPNIEALEIHDARISAEAFRELHVLHALEVLDLAGCNVSQFDLAQLPNRPRVRWLDFSRTNINDALLKSLGDCPAVSHLILAETRIGDEGLNYVAGLQELEWLNLANTGVSSAGINALANLKNLKMLNLDGTSVGDAAISSLTLMPQLETLQIQGAKFTPNGIGQLQKQLPGCQIVH